MNIIELRRIYGDFDFCVMRRNNKIVSNFDENIKIKKYFMSEKSQWILYI